MRPGGGSEPVSTRPDGGRGMGATNPSRSEGRGTAREDAASCLRPDGEGLEGPGAGWVGSYLEPGATCLKSIFHLQRGPEGSGRSLFLEEFEPI